MSLTKTLPLIIVGILAYDVKWFNDGRTESIRIPKFRLKKLKKLGAINCFTDNSNIFMRCPICCNESKIPSHAFRNVRGLMLHVISIHKRNNTPLSIILETLSAIEIFFLQKQGVNIEDLNLL